MKGIYEQMHESAPKLSAEEWWKEFKKLFENRNPGIKITTGASGMELFEKFEKQLEDVKKNAIEQGNETIKKDTIKKNK